MLPYDFSIEQKHKWFSWPLAMKICNKNRQTPPLDTVHTWPLTTALFVIVCDFGTPKQ